MCDIPRNRLQHRNDQRRQLRIRKHKAICNRHTTDQQVRVSSNLSKSSTKQSLIIQNLQASTHAAIQCSVNAAYIPILLVTTRSNAANRTISCTKTTIAIKFNPLTHNTATTKSSHKNSQVETCSKCGTYSETVANDGTLNDVKALFELTVLFAIFTTKPINK